MQMDGRGQEILGTGAHTQKGRKERKGKGRDPTKKNETTTCESVAQVVSLLQFLPHVKKDRLSRTSASGRPKMVILPTNPTIKAARMTDSDCLSIAAQPEE